MKGDSQTSMKELLHSQQWDRVEARIWNLAFHQDYDHIGVHVWEYLDNRMRHDLWAYLWESVAETVEEQVSK